MESVSLPTKKIALIGECMIELSGQPFQNQVQGFGGDTLNTAIYLSRLLPTLSPTYVTALGIDPYSEGMVRQWQAEGIDCQCVLRDRHKLPGLYSIELDEQGERRFYYWRNDAAVRQLCEHPQFSKVIAYLKTCDLVYLSGISLAVLPEHSKALLLNVLSELKNIGVKIAVDSNYRPRLWDSVRHAKSWMMELYALADLALVTADDEAALFEDDDISPMGIASRLQGLGCSQVVVKSGKDGAYWFDGIQNAQGHVMGENVRQVVDTTAAGDSFNAGYLAAWSLEHSMALGCQWGNRLAATVIQHRGAVIERQWTESFTNLLKGYENESSLVG